LKKNPKTGSQLKIIWSDFASETLSEIFQYYKLKASPTIAKKIKAEIFTATQQLKKHPSSGQIELNLEKLNEGYRHLVKGHFKIIYKEVSEGVLITDVFDTRQDPIKINDDERNSRS
jgi:plasmid stabilization system protein ParE